MVAAPRRLILLAAVSLALVMIALIAGLYTARRGGLPAPTPSLTDLFPYGEMRVGIDASYPPFAVTAGDDISGFDVDLARAIGQRLGAPARFVNLGYDGLYDALKADQVDVLISALLVDPTRRNDVRYTTPYFNAGLVLVSPRGTPYVDMKAMAGQALAYEFGSAADAEARRWLRRVLPFETRPYELSAYALDAVRLGEAEAALVDAVAARLYLRQHADWPADYFYVTDNWVAIAVRANRGLTYNAVNEALNSIIEDGTIRTIFETWL